MLAQSKRGGYSMRISVPLMLTLVVSVFLAGCGGQETPTEETEEAGGVERTAVEETTIEETNDRAEATAEETTTSSKATAEETTVTAEAAVPESPFEPAPEPNRGVIGLQEEKGSSASSEGAARDRAQTEDGIGVTQTAAPDPATVGRPLAFTVVVTNNSFPQHVGLQDFLAQGLTLVSATPGQGFCGTLHHGGNLFDCTLGVIPNGGSVAVEVVAIPTVPGTVTNLANAGGGFAPPTSVTAAVMVKPEPGAGAS